MSKMSVADATRDGRSPDISHFLRWVCSVDIRMAAALGSLIVILIGLPLGAALNIWIDEAFTLHTTGAGPIVAWTQANAFESQPPLYFILESLWRTWAKGSIAFARVPSTLFVAAAVAAIVGAASRIAPRVPPLVVAVVAASNPLSIWAAVEMRVYPLVFLLGAMLTWTFYDGFLSSNPSRRAQTGYTVFGILGLYTQYYVGFMLASQAMALIVMRRRSLRPFAVATATITVAYAPQFETALQHARSSGQFVLPTTLAQAAHQVFDSVFVVALPHEVSWSGFAKIAGLAGSAVIVTALTLIGRPEAPRGARLAFLVQWAICLAVFTTLFHLAGVPLDSIKYLTVLEPSSLLIALVFISSLQRMRVLTGGIALAAYAIFTVGTLWGQYRPPLVKPGDWRRVAMTIASDDRGTPVSVFPAELAEPLSWYLQMAIIPIPRAMPYSLDYVRHMALSNESDVARALDPVRARTTRLWLVTTGDCADVLLNYYDYHCRFMESYMQRSYRLVRSVQFRGTLARLYVGHPSRRADKRYRAHAS